MNHVKLLVVSGMVVGLCGCAAKATPTLAGGKPVSHWVENLKNPDPKIRKDAVEKLGNVGGADPAAFPAVCGALSDADPKVRCEAILAVVKFDKTAREIIPRLEVMHRSDVSSQVRDYAGRALKRLQ